MIDDNWEDISSLIFDNCDTKNDNSDSKLIVYCLNMLISLPKYAYDNNDSNTILIVKAISAILGLFTSAPVYPMIKLHKL